MLRSWLIQLGRARLNLPAMMRYLLGRLVSYVITFLLALTMNFLIPRLIPGFTSSPLIAARKAEFGLEGDWAAQYLTYLVRMSLWDFGPSMTAYPLTVRELIEPALPWSVGLLGTSLLISWTVGNLLGAFVGRGRGGKTDKALTPTCLLFSQVPYYFMAIGLMYLLACIVPLFPTWGAYRVGLRPGLNLNFIADVLYRSVLPALSIITVSVATWMITMRSVIVNLLREDYLKLAEAKGLKRNAIVMRYAFRNALLPQTTSLAMSLGSVVTGSFLTEFVFGYPGVGTLFFDAVRRLDYTLIQGILFIITFAVLTGNLIIDLAYPLLDPRISYERT